MSADNGVYIAEFFNSETNETHFRVIHTIGIDNIDYMRKTDGEEAEREEVRVFYEDAVRWSTEQEANEYAWGIYDNLCICEYGVCSIGRFEDIF